MKGSAIVSVLCPVVGLAVAAGLAVSLDGSDAMPQRAVGGDVLSVAFGDTRAVISRAAVVKANDYLHGGVDVDCHALHEHHEGECGDCHDAAPEVGPEPAAGPVDPWRWINERVRAPEVDRHIDDEKAVELMPWFWAAVTADPHNAEAWSTAWYVARYSLRDPSLAKRVIAEALAKNPDSVEIAFTEGRDLYDGGRGDLAAARAAFLRARALGDAQCGGDPSSLSEHDQEAYRFAANYLKTIERALR